MQLFEIKTPLNKQIRLTKENWNKIITEKHPVMKDHFDEIKNTLENSEIIRLSKWDPTVWLYYRKSDNYYICVVTKIENSTGFIITTYLTDKIKIGEELWKR